MPATKSAHALRPQPALLFPPGAALAVTLFVGGLALGWFSSTRNHPDSPDSAAAAAPSPPLTHLVSDTSSHVRGTPAGHAHPLLFCNASMAADATGKLKVAVENELKSQQAKGSIAHAAVVFRDLEAGTGFAIDGDKPYHPASLLKLPLAIAWMRKAELDATALDGAVPYGQNTARESAFTEGALVFGQSYTARDLLGRMIRWSRNDAKAALAQQIGEPAVRAVYRDLGMPWPFANPEADALLSVNDYSRLFRSLYDASIVRSKAADELLTMLNRTDFSPALVSGVPQGVEVAHKWGHRLLRDPTPEATHHLHDCGIVYKPGRPFLLCVMTAGMDQTVLAAAIAEVTRVVWRHLDGGNK